MTTTTAPCPTWCTNHHAAVSADDVETHCSKTWSVDCGQDTESIEVYLMQALGDPVSVVVDGLVFVAPVAARQLAGALTAASEAWWADAWAGAAARLPRAASDDVLAARIAAQVRTGMTRSGLSTAALAERSGVPLDVLAPRVADGNFYLHDLMAVASALGVPMSSLAGEAPLSCH